MINGTMIATTTSLQQQQNKSTSTAGAINIVSNNKDSKGPATNSSSSGSSSRASSTSSKGARPKPVFFWTNLDVLKWLKRHCAELFPLYCNMFEQHDITGRSLVRMMDVNLERLGIVDAAHRDEIWREILKLKLKCDILELRDAQNKSGHLTPN